MSQCTGRPAYVAFSPPTSRQHIIDSADTHHTLCGVGTWEHDKPGDGINPPVCARCLRSWNRHQAEDVS